MPCKRNKNLTQCVSRGRVTVCDGKNFYALYLWGEKQALNDCLVDHEGSRLPDAGDAQGLCCHMPYRERYTENGWEKMLSPKLGEMHFISGQWTMEIVAHECEHAKTHICQMLGINPFEGIEQEEKSAYLLGEMVGYVYRWLWENDPCVERV